MVIPFIPLGWLFIALSALLMSPYFKFMRRFIGWLGQKDQTGIVEKAGEKASKLYEWAGDDQRADQIDDLVKETTHDNGKSLGSKKRNISGSAHK